VFGIAEGRVILFEVEIAAADFPFAREAARLVVIKQSFIEKQIDRSRRDRRTSPFLRRLIFRIVDEAATEHYGATYPTRCIQCSAALWTLLNEFGIRSRLSLGALCIVEVFADRRPPRWGGFWDHDHHVWAVTEFGELADLAVGRLHLHPAGGEGDFLPGPSIWWNDPGRLPPIFRYLPDSPAKPDIAEPEGAADLAMFLLGVRSRYFEMLQKADVAEIAFPGILDGMDTLQRLLEAGDPWATGAFAVQKFGVPFPPWIAEREAELLECWRQRKRAPSRLARYGDVIG
jgi:hypothetical protein